jgi:hypothetical protein
MAYKGLDKESIMFEKNCKEFSRVSPGKFNYRIQTLLISKTQKIADVCLTYGLSYI